MLNRTVLMGRLVHDPELKTTNSGLNVTNFRIAVDRDFVKAGEERQADFFDIVAWRHTANFVCSRFKKGSMIAIDGKLQSRSYQAQDGSNRTVVEVVADSVSFTGERTNNSAREDVPPVQNNATQANFEADTGIQQEFAKPSSDFEDVEYDSDLPF